jgi:hypothetical protein
MSTLPFSDTAFHRLRDDDLSPRIAIGGTPGFSGDGPHSLPAPLPASAAPLELGDLKNSTPLFTPARSATTIDAAAIELNELMWPFFRLCGVFGIHHTLIEPLSWWATLHTACIASMFLLHPALITLVYTKDAFALNVQAAFGVPAIFVYAASCALFRNREKLVDAFALLLDHRRALLYAKTRRHLFQAQKTYVRATIGFILISIGLVILSRYLYTKDLGGFHDMVWLLRAIWLSAFACSFSIYIVVLSVALLAAGRLHELIVSSALCNELRTSVSGDMFRYVLDTVLHNRRRLLECARAIGWLSISIFIVCGGMGILLGFIALAVAGNANEQVWRRFRVKQRAHDLLTSV